MQPTEKQILTANPMVGIPDLIYCPDTLPSPWQEHARPCSGPQSRLLCAVHEPHHPLSPPLSSCFLLALHATWDVLKSFFFKDVCIPSVISFLGDLTKCSVFLPSYFTWHHKNQESGHHKLNISMNWTGGSEFRGHRPSSLSCGVSSMADAASGGSAEGGSQGVCAWLLGLWVPEHHPDRVRLPLQNRLLPSFPSKP